MNFSCYSYTLPFATPLQTSRQTFQYRKGIILCLTKDKQQYYGEAAPLPGFSTESFDDVKQWITKHKNELKNILSSEDSTEQLQKIYSAQSVPASLQFGLDALSYQLEADRSNTSLLNYLFANAIPKVPVNALISLQDDNPIQQTNKYLARGYQTIKCKVGLDIDQELYQLKKIRTQFPDVKIRVDANQAWPLNKAIRNCRTLAGLDIEYCEEPLAENTPKNYEELSQNTELSLALDETLAQHSYWPNLLPFSRYLIIKPMVIGSFKKNIETKRLANTHNNKVVVTTSLESSVGRYFSGILAAGIGSSQTAHGLSTGKFLSKDIFENDAFVANGYFQILENKLPAINFNREQIFRSVF